MTDGLLTIRCIQCLTLNRVPRSKLAAGPRCGSCRAVLSAPSAPAFARADTIDREISYWPETLLLVFTSMSCVYCKISDPVVAELASAHTGRLKVLKIDADSDTYLTGRFKVTKTPSYLVYKNGAFVIRMDGPFKEKSELARWIENLISYTSY